VFEPLPRPPPLLVIVVNPVPEIELFVPGEFDDPPPPTVIV
jgi:hypothetical protein